MRDAPPYEYSRQIINIREKYINKLEDEEQTPRYLRQMQNAAVLKSARYFLVSICVLYGVVENATMQKSTQERSTIKGLKAK